MRVDGARVLITGASSGIGRAMAREAGRRRARVALVARRAEALEETAAEVRAAGGEPLVAAGDVADRAAVEAAVAAAEEAWGGVDIAVANAGVGTEPGKEWSIDELERVTRTNYLGAGYTLLAALPGMLARGSGHLVGVSSLAAYRGLPRGPAYSASKAAMNAYLEGIRVKLAPRGVGVTTVCPGFVDTPISSRARSRPFLIDADDAARRIWRAVERGRRTVDFPLGIVALMWLVRLMPDPVYDRVARRYM